MRSNTDTMVKAKNSATVGQKGIGHRTLSFLIGSLLPITGVYAQNTSTDTAVTFWEIMFLILILATVVWIFQKILRD